MQNVGSKARRKTRSASLLNAYAYVPEEHFVRAATSMRIAKLYIYIYIYIYLYMYRYENKVYMYNQIVSWERFALPFDSGIDSA